MMMLTHMSLISRAFAVLVAIFIVSPSEICLADKRRPRLRNPRVIPAQDFARDVPKLPWKAYDLPVRFQVLGLCFEGNKLWASTSQGLLEIQDDQILALHHWGDETWASSPWTNPNRNELYVMFTGVLMKRDSRGWWDLGPPPFRYVGFGPCASQESIDALHGGYFFQGGSDSFRSVISCFHGERVVLWKPEAEEWEEIAGPPVTQWSATVAAVRGEPDIFFLVREPAFLQPPTYDEYHTIGRYCHVVYSIIPSDREWSRRELPLALHEVATHIIAIGDSAHVRASDGALVEVAPNRVRLHETPGACEALLKSSTGQLLASFKDRGIYSLEDGWKKLRAVPYATPSTHQSALVAEHNGVVALATVSPRPEIPFFTDQKSGQVSEDRLWLLRNGNPVSIDLSLFLACDPTRQKKPRPK